MAIKSNSKNVKRPTTSRRQVLKASAYAGITFAFAPGIARAYAANEKLRVASIGAGGQASGGVSAGLSNHLVAVAEVDWQSRGKGNGAKIKKDSPDTKLYTDYRQLFDKHQDLDAVCIGTPDHHHFPASIRALHVGAGVYCEKPLTWSIWEARKLREVAMKKKLPTQMGNQGHSSGSIREICEHVWSGNLGQVKEVHSISNRRFSAKGRPKTEPIPQGLDWEAWLGPAPFRDFHKGLHPFSWRGYLDFGTGSLGDMACHTMDGPVWALKLNEVESFTVEPEFGKHTDEGYAPQVQIKYQFPKRGDMPPVTLTWYHGGKKPPRPADLDEGQQMQTQGSYLIGDKCSLMSGSHCQGTRLLPAAKAKEIGKPKEMIPRVKGGHRGEWLSCCKAKDGSQPSSNFDYAARLTEIVLIGNVACTVGRKITYNLKTGKTDNDKANTLLYRKPRKGWEFGYEELV